MKILLRLLFTCVLFMRISDHHSNHHPCYFRKVNTYGTDDASERPQQK